MTPPRANIAYQSEKFYFFDKGYWDSYVEIVHKTLKTFADILYTGKICIGDKHLESADTGTLCELLMRVGHLIEVSPSGAYTLKPYTFELNTEAEGNWVTLLHCDYLQGFHENVDVATLTTCYQDEVLRERNYLKFDKVWFDKKMDDLGERYKMLIRHLRECREINSSVVAEHFEKLCFAFNAHMLPKKHVSGLRKV